MTRGMRNNNPCNIRRSWTVNKKTGKRQEVIWKGSLPSKDPEFVRFKDNAHGYRAAFITLNTYNTLHNLWSIRQIISRWAPEKDKNNTQGYIRFICEHMGLEPNHTIVANSPYDEKQEEAKEFVKWMAYQEQGLNVDIDLPAIEEGFRLAFE